MSFPARIATRAASETVTSDGKRHSVSGGVCRAEPLSKADELCRAAAIGDLWSYPKTRSIAELAIDAEERIGWCARCSSGCFAKPEVADGRAVRWGTP